MSRLRKRLKCKKRSSDSNIKLSVTRKYRAKMKKT